MGSTSCPSRGRKMELRIKFSLRCPLAVAMPITMAGGTARPFIV